MALRKWDILSKAQKKILTEAVNAPGGLAWATKEIARQTKKHQTLLKAAAGLIDFEAKSKRTPPRRDPPKYPPFDARWWHGRDKLNFRDAADALGIDLRQLRYLRNDLKVITNIDKHFVTAESVRLWVRSKKKRQPSKKSGNR